MTSSPSQFSFQPDQNSPLSKNIETIDAMNKVFDMYFNNNNQQSPEFKSLQNEEKYDNLADKSQENDENNNKHLINQQQTGKTVLSDITKNSSNLGASKRKLNAQQLQQIQKEAAYQNSMGKMRELGDTIKQSLTTIHNKYAETREDMGTIAQKITYDNLKIAEEDDDEEEQDENSENKNDTKKLQKKIGKPPVVDLAQVWDSQLNQYYQDFLQNAQGALLKASLTPSKIPSIQNSQNQIQKQQQQFFPLQQQKQQKQNINNNNQNLQQNLRKKPMSTQKFSSSSIQLNNNTKKPGSAMRFSNSSIQGQQQQQNLIGRKPQSAQKFPQSIVIKSKINTNNNMAVSGKQSTQRPSASLQQQNQIGRNIQNNNNKMSMQKLQQSSNSNIVINKGSVGKIAPLGISNKSKDIKKIGLNSGISTRGAGTSSTKKWV